MGTGKNMTEEAIRYQRSRSEGYELSSQNRAEVRGYNPSCIMCTYSRNPYRSLRDLGVFEIAAQPVIQLLVPASVERPMAHVMTASRQGCHVWKKIPTAPATDCDDTNHALHFRGAGGFPIRILLGQEMQLST